MREPLRRCLVLAVMSAIVVVVWPAVVRVQQADEGKAPAAKDWPFLGGDLGNQRYSSLNQISLQNVKTLDEYYAAIEAGRFATQRGYSLDDDDRLRREVIMALMCQGRVEFDAIESRFGIDFAATFATELAELAALVEMDWVRIEPRAVQVTPLGWYFVRSVSSVFDAHLRRDQSRRAYSRMV